LQSKVKSKEEEEDVGSREGDGSEEKEGRTRSLD